MSKKFRILLYNPISGHGHLDSWLNIFSTILIKNGHHVLCLTPDHTSLVAHLELCGLTKCDQIQILDWTIEYKESPPSAWPCFWIRYMNEMPCTFAPAGARWPEKLKKCICRCAFKILRTIRNAADKCAKHIGAAVKTCQTDVYLLPPGEMALRIQQAIQRCDNAPDFAFVMYMDMFKVHPSKWTIPGQQMSIPWGGIRFVPNALAKGAHAEGHYADPQLRGMCFLDRQASLDYQKRFPTKVFQHLPDITNATLPTTEPDLVTKLQTAAAGRRIVILGGSLGSRKNIQCFCQLATIANPQEWFFALVGRTYPGTLEDADKLALQKLQTMEGRNAMLHLDYLEDERVFNAMFFASDIIFAAYKDFTISSNMLGKAAAFEKPIMVSTGHMMEEHVTRYGTGIAVPQRDVQAMLDALYWLRDNPISASNYAAYRNDFSHKIMGTLLEEFIQQCVSA